MAGSCQHGFFKASRCVTFLHVKMMKIILAKLKKSKIALTYIQISLIARHLLRSSVMTARDAKAPNEVSPKNSAEIENWLLKLNLSSLPPPPSPSHTHTEAHMRDYPRFIFPRSIPHTRHKCWMIASTAPPVHFRRRLITHMILEMKWLATRSCFPSRCSPEERERAMQQVRHI